MVVNIATFVVAVVTACVVAVALCACSVQSELRSNAE